MDIMSFFGRKPGQGKGKGKGTEKGKEKPDSKSKSLSQAAAVNSGVPASAPQTIGTKRLQEVSSDAGAQVKKSKPLPQKHEVQDLTGDSPAPKDPPSSAAPAEVPGSAKDQPDATSMGGPFEFPQGAPLCLENKTFVVTGVFPRSSRQDVEFEIRKYGGSLKKAVSGRTSFLVAGTALEDGRDIFQGSKYRKAKEKKIKIIGLTDLCGMISSSLASTSGSSGNSFTSGGAQRAKPTEILGGGGGKVRRRSTNTTAASDADTKAAAAIAAEARKRRQLEAAQRGEDVNVLWADKHKPQTTAELLGNKSNINHIRNWLRNWDAWHLKKTKKAPWGKGNPGAKAALVAGPPGIGKSSAAALIAREMGYEVMEFNASDTRSKKLLESSMAVVTGNRVLSFGGKKSAQRRGKLRRLIIMDEVDGMSSGDRGGMKALIAAIKGSKTPIICICNDDQKSSVRSLKNHTFFLKFQRPQKPTVVRRLQQITAKEGLRCENQALEFLIESTGGDIRQILNSLQMWKQSSNDLTFAKLHKRQSQINKDGIQRVSLFEAASYIFRVPRGKRFCGKEHMDLFFVDYAMMPNFVAQNYVRAMVSNSTTTRKEMPASVAKCADLVSEMDLYDSYIRGRQRWDLLPRQAAVACAVGSITQAVTRPEFPEFLGKNSTINKRRRLVHELCVRVGRHSSLNHAAMRMDYMMPVRSHLFRPMITSGLAGVEESVSRVQQYGFTRDDLFETFPEFGLGSFKGGGYENLDKKVKSAFSRKYNSTGKASQGALATAGKPEEQRKLLGIKEKGKGKRKSASSGKGKGKKSKSK